MPLRRVDRPAPSAWGYAAAAALVAVGVASLVLCIVIGRGSAEDILKDSSAVALGEAGIVRAAEPGGYTISYVGPIAAGSAEERERLIDRLGIEVRPEDGGGIVALQPYDVFNDVRFSIDGQSGQAVSLLTFHAPEPGNYVVRSTAATDEPEEGLLLVGRSPYRALRNWVLVGIGLLVVSVVVAVCWAVMVAIDRRRARQEQPGAAPVQLSPLPPLGTGPFPPGVWHGPQGPMIVPPPPPGAGREVVGANRSGGSHGRSLP